MSTKLNNVKTLTERLATFTHEDDADAGHLYCFRPAGAALPPYTTQREVKAIIDIADDGTLAGVELIDDMPPPPLDRITPPDAGVELETTAEERAAVPTWKTINGDSPFMARLLRDHDTLTAALAATIPAKPKEAQAMNATLIEDRNIPGTFRVEAIDHDGGCEVAIFSGPNALDRAIAFAGSDYYDIAEAVLPTINFALTKGVP